MGGTAVHLTGPCFDKTDILKCSFGDEKDINSFIVDNRTAICVSPRFEDIGWKLLTLLVIRNDIEVYFGESQFYAGIILVGEQ